MSKLIPRYEQDRIPDGQEEVYGKVSKNKNDVKDRTEEILNTQCGGINKLDGKKGGEHIDITEIESVKGKTAQIININNLKKGMPNRKAA